MYRRGSHALLIQAARISSGLSSSSSDDVIADATAVKASLAAACGIRWRPIDCVPVVAEAESLRLLLLLRGRRRGRSFAVDARRTNVTHWWTAPDLRVAHALAKPDVSIMPHRHEASGRPLAGHVLYRLCHYIHTHTYLTFHRIPMNDGLTGPIIIIAGHSRNCWYR